MLVNTHQVIDAGFLGVLLSELKLLWKSMKVVKSKHECENIATKGAGCSHLFPSAAHNARGRAYRSALLVGHRLD